MLRCNLWANERVCVWRWIYIYTHFFPALQFSCCNSSTDRMKIISVFLVSSFFASNYLLCNAWIQIERQQTELKRPYIQHTSSCSSFVHYAPRNMSEEFIEFRYSVWLAASCCLFFILLVFFFPYKSVVCALSCDVTWNVIVTYTLIFHTVVLPIIEIVHYLNMTNGYCFVVWSSVFRAQKCYYAPHGTFNI